MLNNDNDTIVKQINYFAGIGKPFLVVVDFEMQAPIVFPLDEIPSGEILYNFNGFKNYTDSYHKKGKVIIQKIPISFRHYENGFNFALKHIKYGNSYLLNLTYPTQISVNYSLKELFFISKSKYKLFFRDKFIVFSPETFIKIGEGKIYTFPMKGTIDASIPDAKNIILNDAKEKAEHFTIIDLLRNDLSMVAKNVHVSKFRYIDEIRTNQKSLLQVSSIIQGDLPKGYQQRLGDIIFTLLPAGSVSGAPKQKTVEIIKSAENYCRGYYTGIAGIFDGVNFDSMVMIRYIENINGKFYYKSGGGITFMSNPVEEYNELIDKVYVPVC